jgi:F-type H+-transporting ATPase subunit delta
VRRTSTAVVRRYARALLDAALDREARGEGTAEELQQELRGVVNLLQGNRELRLVLGHPAITAEQKKRILGALLTGDRASPLLRRLLDLLVTAERLQALAAIEEAFGEAWNARRGIATAEAVSALPLAKAQGTALAAALGKATGLTVEVRQSVDPELLGGLLVRLAGKTYDGTVRSKLHRLRQHLRQAG